MWILPPAPNALRVWLLKKIAVRRASALYLILLKQNLLLKPQRLQVYGNGLNQICTKKLLSVRVKNNIKNKKNNNNLPTKGNSDSEKKKLTKTVNKEKNKKKLVKFPTEGMW